MNHIFKYMFKFKPSSLVFGKFAFNAFPVDNDNELSNN